MSLEFRRVLFRPPMTRWALLDPLVSYWNALHAAARGEPTHMADAAQQWVGDFPLIGSLHELTEEVIDRDLTALASTTIANPSVRSHVREHLLKGPASLQDGG